MADKKPSQLDLGSGVDFVADDATGTTKKARRATIPSLATTGGLVASEFATDTFTTVAAVAGQLIMFPFRARKPRSTFRLAVNAAAFTSAANCRIGIYKADPVTHLPTTLVVDSGVIAITAAGIQFSPNLTADLVEGERYFFAFICDGTTVSFAVYGTGRMPPVFNFDATGVRLTKAFRTMTFGALPADESAQTYTLNTNTFNPVVFLAATA